MSDQILQTKLFIPPLRPSLVPRPRLLQRLNDGAGGKLILVSAPAGFGKTTLICDWLAGQETPAGWLSLDENDNQPLRFFSYLPGDHSLAPARSGGRRWPPACSRHAHRRPMPSCLRW